MRIENLPDLEPKETFINGTIKCATLQSQAIASVKDSYVAKVADSFQIVTYDIRGHMVRLLVSNTELITLKELCSNYSVDHSLIEVIKYEKGQKKVNTLYEVRNGEGVWEVPVHGFSLHYPTLDMKIQETKSLYHIIEDHTSFANGDYVFFVNNYYDIDDRKSIVILHRASLFNALINMQIHFGFKEIELKALAIQPTQHAVVDDNDIISIGNSFVYRIDDIVYVVEKDLFELLTSEDFLTKASRVGELRDKLNLTGVSKEKIGSTEIKNSYLINEGMTEDKVNNGIKLIVRSAMTQSLLLEVAVYGYMYKYQVEEGVVLSRFKSCQNIKDRQSREVEVRLSDNILGDKLMSKQELRNLSLEIVEGIPVKKSRLFSRNR